jgi:hypothetical protein
MALSARLGVLAGATGRPVVAPASAVLEIQFIDLVDVRHEH